MKKTSLVMVLLIVFLMFLTFALDAKPSISIPEAEQVNDVNDWDDWCPVIEVDSASNPHIAWATPDVARYAIKSGDSWSIENIATDPPMSGGGWNWISLRLDSQEHPHIAWALPTPDPEIFYSYWDGNEWITTQVTDWDATEGAEVALALDSNDQPHIVWDSRYQGTWGVFYSEKTDSGWTFEVISHHDDSHPSIAIAKDDIPHVSWNRDFRVPGGGLWHASRVGGTWTAQLVIESPAEGSTSGQHIAFDSLGNPHFVAVNRTTSEILYVYKEDNSVSVTPIAEGKRPSIALNANNIPYVAWDNDGDIYLAYQEQQWTVYNISNQPLEEQRPNIAIDARGNVHLVWHGPGHGQGASEIYYTKVSVAVTATVDIDPDTLNLKSNGQWITVYITLPEGYNVEDIVLETVYLDGIPAAWSDIQNGVYMIKFDRATVQASATNEPDYESALKFYDLPLTVTGQLVDGTSFEGSDTITVIKR